jgi:transcriptional regulator with XRE-family HTH domain
VPRLTTQTHRLALGARLRQLREEQGLSQEQLAERAARHRAYVGAVERGERNPTLDVLHSLARGLGVDLADLFTEGHPARHGRETRPDLAAEGRRGYGGTRPPD